MTGDWAQPVEPSGYDPEQGGELSLILSGEELDVLAGLAFDLDPGSGVLGVEDEPDPARDPPPPPPSLEDGPQDVEQT